MAPLLLIGAALGGTAMYFFDPDRGRRRRALLRDQAVKVGRRTGELFEAGARDLSNRAFAVASARYYSVRLDSAREESSRRQDAA